MWLPRWQAPPFLSSAHPCTATNTDVTNDGCPRLSSLEAQKFRLLGHTDSPFRAPHHKPLWGSTLPHWSQGVFFTCSANSSGRRAKKILGHSSTGIGVPLADFAPRAKLSWSSLGLATDTQRRCFRVFVFIEM